MSPNGSEFCGGSVLSGTTTYKAFKVRLRLFFSDFIGCCEWMMGCLIKGLLQMSYIGCGIIIWCKGTDVPIKSVSLRLNCADRSYRCSSRDILVSVCYLF